MFQINETQWKRINAWFKELFPDGWPYSGAAGGRVTYCFTPTGLGPIVVVKCVLADNITVAELDVTEYEHW